MNELGDLRGRVEQAVGKLLSSHEARRRENRSLLDLLGNLEDKFNARSQELDYCNARIEALTRENAELGQLLVRLVGLIERDPEADREDPLHSASAMVAGMLESSHGSSSGDAEAAPLAEVDPTGHDDIVADDAALDDAAPAEVTEPYGDTPDMTAGFEDATAEELAVEASADIADDLLDQVRKPSRPRSRSTTRRHRPKPPSTMPTRRPGSRSSTCSPPSKTSSRRSRSSIGPWRRPKRPTTMSN